MRQDLTTFQKSSNLTSKNKVTKSSITKESLERRTTMSAVLVAFLFYGGCDSDQYDTHI